MTVGKKCSRVVAITSDAKPTRFNHAWAGLIVAQLATIGGQPARNAVAIVAPTATSREGDDIPLDHESATRAQRPTERAHGRGRGQHDPGDIPAAADHREPDAVSRNAEGDAGRTERDGTDRGGSQSRITRRRGRECRGEERHHASDRGGRPTRQRQMERQPGTATRGLGNHHRHDRGHEERDGDDDREQGDPSVG